MCLLGLFLCEVRHTLYGFREEMLNSFMSPTKGYMLSVWATWALGHMFPVQGLEWTVGKEVLERGLDWV